MHVTLSLLYVLKILPFFSKHYNMRNINFTLWLKQLSYEKAMHVTLPLLYVLKILPFFSKQYNTKYQFYTGVKATIPFSCV